MSQLRITLVLLGGLAMAGCDALTPSAPSEEEVLDGTIEGMTGSQVGQHLAGDQEFGRVFAEKDGLGPIFVASSRRRASSATPVTGRATRSSTWSVSGVPARRASIR